MATGDRRQALGGWWPEVNFNILQIFVFTA
jgi:hypothetical protein